MRIVYRFVIALCCLLLSLLPLLAQSTTATMVGRIMDATGSTIPGARLTIHNQTTGQDRAAEADAAGDFTVPNLAPGQYDLIVEAAGFRKLVQSGVELQVNQTARLELTMQVGSTSDTIEVTASVPLLNTDNAVNGDVIAQEEISEMPLNGRNFADLAFLVPGVTQQVQGGGSGGGYVVNGFRSDNTNFTVDGFNNQNPSTGGAQVSPTLEAMQEFRVQTTGFSAENGRLGGGVVSMAMKTGGNKLHGAVFDYFRNDALNARNFFAVDKPLLRRNQYGFQLDGPIVIPKLFNGRNKTFFLFSWEGLRQHSGAVRLAVVPSALQRGGNFSQVAGGVKDPLNNNVLFPGGIIPSTRFDSVALRVLKFMPEENRPGQYNNYYSAGNSVNRDDNYVLKLDQRFNSKDSFSGRVVRNQRNLFDPYDNTGDLLGRFGASRAYRNSLIGTTWTHLFSPTVINEARFGFNRYDYVKWTGFAGFDPTSTLGLPRVATDPRLFNFPIFGFSGYTGMGGDKYAPSVSVVNQWQWGNTLSIAKRSHLIRAGVDIARSQYFEPYNLYANGNYSFTGTWTGNSIGDLLLGYPNSTEQQPGGRSWAYVFATNYGAFVQDDWKIRSNLTLNLGLRYELPVAPIEKYGQLANFVPGLNKIVIVSDQRLPNLQQQLAAAKLTNMVVLGKDVQIPDSLAYTNYTKFAPRFGFAWRPLGGTKLVLRGGYGIYYANNALVYIRKDLGNNYPFTIDQKWSTVKGNPQGLTLQDPFPAARAASFSSVTKAVGYQVDAPSPYNQSWNLTLERQIGDSAIELAYIGSKGTHLGKRYDINEAWKDRSLVSPTGALFKPWSSFSNINYYSFGTNSSYQAGQITFRRRLARGFFYRFNYVFSKSLDYASQLASGGNNGFDGAQDSRNLKLERGRSDSDRRHVFNMNFMYEVSRGNRWIKGWQIAGTGTMYSGVGMTVQTSANDNSVGDADRPDRIGWGQIDNPSPARWFDTSAFLNVPKGSMRDGTAGRNIIDGPGMVSINASLMKKFAVHERSYAQLRIETFNLTNHANFRLPNLDMSSAAVSTITQANDGRAMQLALRFVF